MAKKKSPPKKPDPDEGMLPGPNDTEFNPNAYATEEEAMAALRARIGDEAFERMSSSDGWVAGPPNRPRREDLKDEHLMRTFPDIDDPPAKPTTPEGNAEAIAKPKPKR